MGSRLISGKPQQPKRRQWTEQLYRGGSGKRHLRAGLFVPHQQPFLYGALPVIFVHCPPAPRGRKGVDGEDKNGRSLMCESVLGAGSHPTAFSSFHAGPSI